MRCFFLVLLTAVFITAAHGQPSGFQNYNLVWDQQSENVAGSMPCGGGDIGLNVWVEDDELLSILQKAEHLMKIMA